MKKFKYEFEVIRYPLIILLISLFFNGLSNTILTKTVMDAMPNNLMWFVSLMAILQYFSAIIIQYFPFLIVVKALGKIHNSHRVTLIFFISHILLLAMTMVLGKNNLEAVAYQDLFGITSIYGQKNFTIASLIAPYRIGLFGAIISGIVVNFAYKITRTRTRYGFVSYIDKDVLSLIFTILFTLIIGGIFIFIWPYFIKTIFNIFKWISNDITNPISTFVYGFIDRILSLFNLSALNRETFWFTNLGGSYMSSSGESFVGDVTIFQEMTLLGIYDSGFGRFITPHYLINLFAIPGLIVGILSLYTNREERIKHVSLAVILIAISFVSDISLVFELFMVVMTPLFYFMHIIVVSSLFAILQGFDLFMGSNGIRSITNYALGNGFEFIGFLNNDSFNIVVLKLSIIGIVVFFTYVIFIRFYYNKLAIGLINKFDIEHLTDEFLEIVGGLNNIEVIDSTPLRIEVVLKRPQLFNYSRLEKTKIARVLETRTIYAIYYGSASPMIRKEVLIRKSISES